MGAGGDPDGNLYSIHVFFFYDAPETSSAGGGENGAGGYQVGTPGMFWPQNRLRPAGSGAGLCAGAGPVSGCSCSHDSGSKIWTKSRQCGQRRPGIRQMDSSDSGDGGRRSGYDGRASVSVYVFCPVGQNGKVSRAAGETWTAHAVFCKAQDGQPADRPDYTGRKSVCPAAYAGEHPGQNCGPGKYGSDCAQRRSQSCAGKYHQCSGSGRGCAGRLCGN